jgi:hypothetical protein
MARALFQIARGVDTSSLSNGELYYNQTTQSLQLGTNNNTIITLAKLNDLNTGSFGITGNLFVSGNTNIVGNLTFGDSTIDTVTVVASLSSSLIPDSNDSFDLGDVNTYWKTAYISAITGSLSGSVNGVDITPFSSSVSHSIGNLNNTSASHELRLDALEQHSGSVNSFTASITSSYNATSQSLNSVSSSLFNVSGSYIATSQSLNTISSSLLTFSSSLYKNDSSSFSTRVTLLESTASVLKAFSASVSTSVGLLQTFSASQYIADSSSVNSRITSIENYTSSLKSAIELTGSNVTIQGDLFVRGTTTTVNSTTVNLSASFIEVDAGGGVNGGIYVIDKVNNAGGLTITGSLFWDVTNDVWKAGKSGSEQELAHIQDITTLSSSIYQTDLTQSISASIVSASAWGAFQSASAYSKSVYDTLYWPSTGLSASLSSGSQYQVNILSASLYTAVFGLSPNSLSGSISTSIGILSGSISSSISQLSSSVSQSIYDNVWGNVNSVSYSFASASTAYSSSVSQSLYQSIYFPSTGLSASFDSRISASTLTFNDTTGQTGIDFTQVGTQISAIASGLATGSSVKFNSITASYVSASGTVYCDTLVATTLVGATLPVLQYTTQGTLGNILIKGDTSKSIHVIDTITFTGITETAGNSSQATGLLMTGSITASSGFSGSSINVGKVIANDITASGNLYVSGTIYTYELHTIIESSSVIYSSGSTNIGDAQNDILTITGSLYQTGSTSFSELSGSLFAFSASLNNRIGTTNVTTLSSSIYQTDATQSNNITIISASAWGAFQSASSYSASIYTRDAGQDTLITQASASTWGAFQSASSYSSSFYTTINTVSSSLTTVSASANGAFASASTYSSSFYTTINTVSSSLTTTSASAAGAFASASSYSSSLSSSISASTAIATGYSASAAITYAKLAVANTFTQNQIISGSLTVTGDVVAYASSDERLKDNIQLISNPIEKVQQLRGVEFDWNDKASIKKGQHDYGVIAQDVQKVFPELISQRYDGYMGVDYDKMIGLLIEVVKEQEKRIKELENKIGS